MAILFSKNITELFFSIAGGLRPSMLGGGLVNLLTSVEGGHESVMSSQCLCRVDRIT